MAHGLAGRCGESRDVSHHRLGHVGLDELGRPLLRVTTDLTDQHDRVGIRVLRDPYTAKPYILFYTTKRVGGGVQNFEAIKLLKFGTS